MAAEDEEEGEDNRAGRPAFESARVETETSPAFEEGRKSNMNMIKQHFPCSLALRTRTPSSSCPPPLATSALLH
jgi:hypothetical protein